MAKLLKLRRGTTSQHSSFTGAEGEVTVDTDKETLVVHNGSTAGGFPLARADNADSQKTRWGTGNDLEIYHDGGNSWVKEAGTGALYIDTNGSVIKITHTAGNETMANFYKDGAVELYHNNAIRLKTTANGVTVDNDFLFDNSFNAGKDVHWQPSSDRLAFFDNVKATFGDGVDLQLYHNGSNSVIQHGGGGHFYVQTTGTDEDLILKANRDIYIQPHAGESGAKFIKNGAVELYYDNSKKLNTYSGGIEVTGLKVLDNNKLKIGNAEDLQIYHNGANSIIENATGALVVKPDGLMRIQDKTTGEIRADFNDNSSVDLYNDNSLRLSTTSTGLKFRGGSSGFYGVMETNDGNNRGYLHANSSETVGLLDDQQHWLLNGTKNGGNNLYYDNSKKFETKSGGAEIYGDLEFGDSKYAYFGNSNDLRIYHNGSNSFVENTTEVGHLFLRNNGPVDKNIYIQARAGEDSITCENDGAVNLYFNNLKKLETWNDGIIVRGREGSMGSVDIYADEGDNNADKWRLKANNAGEFQLQNYSTGAWNKNINISGNNQVELYYGHVKKFETTSTGIIVTGNVDITGSYSVDNGEKFVAGDSSDVQLYHDGHSKLIHNGDGHFYIKTEGADEDLVINAERNAYIQCSAGEHGVICKEDAEVELYYNNAVKFETRGFGVRTFGHLGVNVDPGNTPNTRAAFVAIGDSDTGVAQNGDGQLELWANNQEIMNIDTGEVTFYKPAIPSANNTHDLGSTSYRWRNLYVNDAHFSNEGSSNSVDGTWGDWTLQEGEDTIFMLNNRTGKKYKMNLTEVS